MAAPAHRASTAGGNGTGANITLSNPAGTANGDILVFVISKDATGAITPPSGGSNPVWTTIIFDTADGYCLGVYAARWATGNTTSHVFSFASTYRDCSISAFSGAVSSGTFLDPPSGWTITTSSSAATLSTPSVTTATADVLLVAVHNQFNGGTWTPGSSMTERVDNGEEHVQDVAQAVAGASGTKSATVSGAATFMKAVLFGIASVAAGAAVVIPKSLMINQAVKRAAYW